MARIPDELRWKATGRTIGAGGQASVQEVIDQTSGTDATYAMKVLSNTKSSQAYDRFVREIEAVKSLQHRGIMTVIDHSQADASFHYYVMEYLADARTLSEVIDTATNPFYGNAIRVLDLAAQILDVLIACETAQPRVVHRDLKPANILVLPDDTIRVIDFGICQIEGDTPITLDDEGVGSANYMAPECEAGAPGSVSSAADLYSLGKILWSAITGKRAFAREEAVFGLKSMQSMFPDCPETWHLFHVFEYTIRREPSDRFASAAECLKAVQLAQRLVLQGYPPLELQPRCPSCGVGELQKFDAGHMVFGNPNPRGILSVQCSYCGICFAINAERIKSELSRRSSLS